MKLLYWILAPCAFLCCTSKRQPAGGGMYLNMQMICWWFTLMQINNFLYAMIQNDTQWLCFFPFNYSFVFCTEYLTSLYFNAEFMCTIVRLTFLPRGKCYYCCNSNTDACMQLLLLLFHDDHWRVLVCPAGINAVSLQTKWRYLKIKLFFFKHTSLSLWLCYWSWNWNAKNISNTFWVPQNCIRTQNKKNLIQQKYALAPCWRWFNRWEGKLH